MLERSPPPVVQIFQDELIRQMELRHGWLKDAAEQIREWKSEDARNNCPWGDEK